MRFAFLSSLSVALAVAAAVGLVVAGCGGRTGPTPVVVDTDMSTDDIVVVATGGAVDAPGNIGPGHERTG